MNISGIILCMRPANERWRYTVTPSLFGWTHTQNDPGYIKSNETINLTGVILPDIIMMLKEMWQAALTILKCWHIPCVHLNKTMPTASRHLNSPLLLPGTSTHNPMVTHRSWSWMINSHPFRSMSISLPIPWIRLFQTLTLRLQGQGHGCSQRARPYSHT